MRAGGQRQNEIDGLGLADGRGDRRPALALESGRVGFHRIGAGLQLGEAETAGIASADAALDAVACARKPDSGACQRGAGRVGDLPPDRASGLALRTGARRKQESHCGDRG